MTTNNAPKCALIVIDMQSEYFTGGLPIEYPDPQRTIANIGAAMDTACETGIPVIVMQQTPSASSPLFVIGTDSWQLHPVVVSRPHDHYLCRLLPSVYPEMDLTQWLAARGIDMLTVVGHMTHNCDASIINHALHNGTAVEFLYDASDVVPYQDQASLASAGETRRVLSVVLQPRFATVTSTQEWVYSAKTGAVPVCGNIYKSNQWARGLPQDEVAQQVA